MKTYHFSAQKESEECPAVPRAVSVRAESLHVATKTLAKALKEDPKLEKPHPEFMPEEEKAAPVESKSTQRINAARKS